MTFVAIEEGDVTYIITEDFNWDTIETTLTNLHGIFQIKKYKFPVYLVFGCSHCIVFEEHDLKNPMKFPIFGIPEKYDEYTLGEGSAIEYVINEEMNDETWCLISHIRKEIIKEGAISVHVATDDMLDLFRKC